MLGSPKRSALISACLHAGAIVLIVTLTTVPNNPITKPLMDRIFTPVDVPPHQPMAAREHHGGGGGGQHDLTPARFGQLARFSPREFVAPTTHPTETQPPLMMEPTILADALPNIQPIDFSKLGNPAGVHYGTSGGTGKDGGIGDGGKGGGVGDKNGPGYGNGDGPDSITTQGSGSGGRLTAPVLLFQTQPEYSEDARRARMQGTVVVRIEIDAQGRPRDPRVLQSLGLGLDERAVDTVMRWKFKAATRDGRPIAATAMIEVTFRLL